MILLTVGLALSAPQASFDQGVKALRSESFEQAEHAFIDTIEQGGVDPDVYHGLGNALYRQGKTGEAAAAWQRGVLLEPDHSDLTHNLAHFRGDQGDGYVPFPIPQLTSLSAWTLMAVLSGMGVCGLIGWTNRRFWSVSCIVLAIVLGAIQIQMSSSSANAVMILPTVLATSMPEGAGVDLFSLTAGTDITLLEESELSYRIELGNGDRGWIPKQSLILSDPDSPFEVQ
ncbi:MAG: tetratricopeptide repeat protein [Myxococcota bacterium]